MTPEINPKPQRLSQHIVDTLILAGPVIAGQLGHVAIGQADTMMVGELGSRHLAAATLAGSVWILFAIVGMGVFSAVGPLTAQWRGAGRPANEMGRLLQQSVLLAMGIGAILCLLQIVLAEFLDIMGQPLPVVELARPYLRIIAISTIPMMGFLAIKAFVEGYEQTWPGLVVTAFMFAFNVLFNWLLIHGHWGFPRLELDGAGYATLLARSVGMLLMMGYLAMDRDFKALWPRKGVFRLHKAVSLEVLKLGLPSGAQYFFEVGAFAGAVFLAGLISEDAMSAHQIAIGVASITFMFYLGFSIAASIRVGNAMGRGDAEGLRLAGWAGFMCGLVAIVLFVVAMVAFREELPWLYIKEEAVVRLAVPLLVIGAIFQVFDGIQAIGVGVLRGMSDVRIPTLSTFIAYWVIGLPAAAWLMFSYDMGLEGIWYGLTAGLAVSAVAMSMRFHWKTKRR